MESKQFENNDIQNEGMDIYCEMALESFKELKENKRNIEDFIQFLEALNYCENPDEVLEYDMPFSLN